MESALFDFIDAAKTQGASDEFVIVLLRHKGWPEKQIYQELSSWYELRTGKTIPSGGGRMEAAKDAALHLLAFVTLCIWAVQLGALLFSVINLTFPNPALGINREWEMRALASEMASVLVAFPVFFLVTRRIEREAVKRPDRESAVRRWLMYFVLVVAATVVIGDVATLVAYFLRGDLDIRFLLKVATVLAIAGTVFGYHFELPRTGTVAVMEHRPFALAAAGLVLIGMVAGFLQIGSPARQRALSQDHRRLADLSSLANGVHEQWMHARDGRFVLPADIQDLTAHNAQSHDPVTGAMYEYRPASGTDYQLCATFARASESGMVEPVWQHTAGRYCFALDATRPVQVVPQVW